MRLDTGIHIVIVVPDADPSQLQSEIVAELKTIARQYHHAASRDLLKGV
jgi:hypothetical protein